MARLENKVALISGGSRGMGLGPKRAAEKLWMQQLEQAAEALSQSFIPAPIQGSSWAGYSNGVARSC